MARYKGPKSKISRRFGEPIFGPDKVLSKKNYAPGEHGNGRRRKQSEYSLQLGEKQKAKYTYGVLAVSYTHLDVYKRQALRISVNVSVADPDRVWDCLLYTSYTLRQFKAKHPKGSK